MSKERMTLISAAEYDALKGERGSQEKYRISPKWHCNIAGIILIISAIISFNQGTILVTWWDTTSFASQMCWLSFQIVFTLPAIVGAVSAFTKRKYQYALAGAAMSIGVTIVLGVVALIFLYWGVDEFGKYEGTLE